ncbi:hypothetical protein HN014_04770 [Aquimarina sp. TRL1]|nr:hypothetical protein HN014_04770 [Aquimarina sp. TRL1]
MLHKIGSFVLACIVLLSTMSFTVHKHYCGKILVDASLYTKAKTCGMEAMYDIQEGQKSSMEKKSCCSDETVVIEGQNELKTSFDQLDMPQQLWITSFVYTYIKRFVDVEQQPLLYLTHSPPERTRDIVVLYETFLI